MLLAFAFNNPFAPLAVDPSLQRVEFVDRSFVRFLQLLIGDSRFIEHALQFGRLLLGVDSPLLKLCGLLESGQQELLALGKIVGKSVGVIHNAHCCNDSCQE